MKRKVKNIFFNSVPVIFMIGSIPIIKNDYLLAVVYILIIAIALKIKKERNDFLFLVFGFFVMIVSEAFFISTRVETFNRNSLFGLMPIWLPILWAYVFVAMKRAIKTIEE